MLGGQTKSCPTVANGYLRRAILDTETLQQFVVSGYDVIKQLSPHSLLDFFVAFFEGDGKIGQESTK